MAYQVGILTERDFLLKVAGQPGFEALPVSQFMTPGPETVAPTDTLGLIPDKLLEPDWLLFKTGRDTALEWITAQPVVK